MPGVATRKQRAALFLSIAGLLVMVAAVSAVSARDPSGVSWRVGMIMAVAAASMCLPWQALPFVAIGLWLGPNAARSVLEGSGLFEANMMLELPGLAGVAVFAHLARLSLRLLEEAHIRLASESEIAQGIDPETGVFCESRLRPAVEAELSRSRRFGRTFALVLIGIDQMRQKFDYRDAAAWKASFAATAQLLKGTRANIDRVYRYGPASFAMVLPESGPKEVNGMIRRLRRVARRAKPAEGEPGGPLPVYFGATFFPQCATTTEDLLKRAEVALRIADGNANRVQFDGAEAPEMPPVESLRHNDQPLEASDDASAETAARPEADAGLVPDSPAVHAVQAPKFAVDSVEREWNAEAPLTVLRSPGLQDASNSLVEKKGSDLELLDESLANALRQLDTTLSLIRSLKERVA